MWLLVAVFGPDMWLCVKHQFTTLNNNISTKFLHPNQCCENISGISYNIFIIFSQLIVGPCKSSGDGAGGWLVLTLRFLKARHLTGCSNPMPASAATAPPRPSLRPGGALSPVRRLASPRCRH